MQVVDKPWFPDYPPTLPHVIHDCVAKHADRTFLIEGESQWTFRQIGERSARLARGLTALGVGKAHRVGIIMPNNKQSHMLEHAQAAHASRQQQPCHLCASSIWIGNLAKRQEIATCLRGFLPRTFSRRPFGATESVCTLLAGVMA